MKSEIPTVSELVESPEVGMLHALQVALRLAERALEAAHPEIDDADLRDEPLTTYGYLADTIRTHIAGLDLAIDRYRHLLEYRTRRLLRPGTF